MCDKACDNFADMGGQALSLPFHQIETTKSPEYNQLWPKLDLLPSVMNLRRRIILQATANMYCRAQLKPALSSFALFQKKNSEQFARRSPGTFHLAFLTKSIFHKIILTLVLHFCDFDDTLQSKFLKIWIWEAIQNPRMSKMLYQSRRVEKVTSDIFYKFYSIFDLGNF